MVMNMEEAQNEYAFLRGKDVKVKKTDGFVKIGHLIDINQTFIVLQYYDGRVEIIPVREIEGIVEIVR